MGANDVTDICCVGRDDIGHGEVQVTQTLFIHASPLGREARGFQVAARAIENLRDRHASLRITERALGQSGLPPISAAYADAVRRQLPASSAEFKQAEELIEEVEASDYLVLSTPIHNYAAPAALKLWIDYVLRLGRTFGVRDGRKVGLLRDRPSLCVVASGSRVMGEGALQPDYLTPYLKDVLATLGLKQLSFIHLQGLIRPDNAEEELRAGLRAIDEHPVFGRRVSAARDMQH